MNFDLNNKYAEAVLVIAMSTILALVGVYYFPILLFLYPVLFVALGVRQGVNLTMISLSISALSIGLMIDVMSGLFLLIAYLPLSIAIIYSIKKRKNPTEVLLISTLIFLGSILSIMGIVKNIAGIGIIEQLNLSFTELLESQVQMLEGLNLSDYQIIQVKGEYKNLFEYVLTIIPSMIIIFCLATAYLNYLLSSLLLRRLNHAIVHIPKFSRFDLPSNTLLGIGIMVIITWLLGYLDIFNSDAVLKNIITIASFIFFIQGLAVIAYKMIQKKINIIIRIFVAVIITLAAPILGNFITMFGFLDLIFDFRKIRHAT